jgi:hypothetical protein
VHELRDEIHRYIRFHNERSAKPFRWTEAASAIIEKRDSAADKLLNGTSHT